MAKSICLISMIIIILLFCLGCNANLTSVTYPGIGTFTLTDFYDPIYRPLVFLPDSPEEIDPKFLLFTPQNPSKEDSLDYNNTDNYNSTHFDPKLSTKIIVHGWNTGSKPSDFYYMFKMKDYFLTLEDFNVILVEWPKGALKSYIQSVADTRVVGPMIAILIRNLNEKFNVNLDSFHLIGHSLGAHVVGYAGKFLNGKLDRITGLDPAGPLYQGLKNTSARLWYTDAQFVDSIHTDANLTLSPDTLLPDFGFGMYETCSDVDFYPNGGDGQPGCDPEDLIDLLVEGLGITKYSSCNHHRSIEFFTESILPSPSTTQAYMCSDYDSFVHGKCTDCGKDGSQCIAMGYPAVNYRQSENTTQGERFFMATTAQEPFFRFQYLIEIQMGSGSGMILSILRQVKLRFTQENGTEETFEFNDENGSIFEDAKDYPQTFVLDTDPEKLTDVEFQWSQGLDLLPGTMNVASLLITDLSFESAIKSPTSAKYVPDESNEIPNDKWVSFKLEK